MKNLHVFDLQSFLWDRTIIPLGIVTSSMLQIEFN